MADSSTTNLDPSPLTHHSHHPGRIRIRRWLGAFGLYLVVLGLPSAVLLAEIDGPWTALFTRPGDFTAPHHQLLKLLIVMLYLAFCNTFLPLPTGWLVAAVATREVALTGELWSTALLLALAGGVASTVANLNDYHVISLMLRHRRLAALRETRLYHAAARWFVRAPFTFQLVSNLVPIPIDVVRMVAILYGYPRRLFALANFLGRFLRYGTLAAVAFAASLSPMAASLIMLGIALALALLRWLLPPALRWMGRGA